MTWSDRASQIIHALHATLPGDMDFAARKRAVRAARPWDFGATSWGRKTWSRASRSYLARFGRPASRDLRTLPLFGGKDAR